jgi:transposase-like protein
VARPKGSVDGSSYTPEFKLRVVKESVEKKLNAVEVEKAYGVGVSTWYRWKKLYRDGGDEAIRRDGNTPIKGKRKPPSPGA